MGIFDIILIVLAVAVAVGAGLFFLNRWAYKRMGEQQSIIERTKQITSIYVIDKAKMRASQSNLPNRDCAPVGSKFGGIPVRATFR